MMQKASESLEFERAQELKEQLNLLENYQLRSTVVHSSISDVDVFTILSDDRYGYINFMKIVNGAIVQSHTAEVKKIMEEEDAEILQNVIPEIRDRFNSQSTSLFTNVNLDWDLREIKIHIPQRGDKKKLIDMSLRNVKYFMRDRQSQQEKKDPDRRMNRILGQLQSDLRLKEMPVHIECFDNSNFQGTNAVAACVVFKDAKPSKKDYRHFNIKSVEGPDDFASMREVVYRRYKRLLDEEESLPQLIVIDGGKGQLSSAVESLRELGIMNQLTVIGIAKKLEEIYFPGDQYPIYIDKRSESLKLIQHLRNEAHRFGITHHRNKRSKAIKSGLTDIPGLGPKSVEKLLQKFKSVKRIKEASESEWKEVLNRKQLESLRKWVSSSE
jgi:excinuclease ABC subunit C